MALVYKKLHERSDFWALESLRSCFGPLNRFAHAIFGPKTGQMVLMYKKLPMWGAVYMSLYKVISRRIHSLGNLKGVQLQHLQIARVMDTAASKSLHSGTHKLHPPLIVMLEPRDTVNPTKNLKKLRMIRFQQNSKKSHQ